MNHLALHLKGVANAARTLPRRDPRVPELPAPSSLLGWLGVFGREPLTVIERAMQVGDLVRFRMAYQDIYLINRPDAIKHVLQDNDDNYRRGMQSHGELKQILGRGMLTADGREWAHYRELAQPSFKENGLSAFAACTERLIPLLLERWEEHAAEGRPLSLAPETMRLAIRISTEHFFGYTLEDALAFRFFDALSLTQADLFHRAAGVESVLAILPLPRVGKVARAYRFLDRLSAAMAAYARQHDVSGTYLGHLLQYRGAQSQTGALPEEILEAQIMTMLVSAPENPSNLLTFALFTLGTQPDVEARMREEVGRVFGSGTPTLAGLRELSYTRRVVQETLRLYPGAWGFERCAIEEDEIAGRRIPAGSTILLSPYAMHRHPQYWDRPRVFDPDRFLPEVQAARPRYAYYPFGGGKRVCIGMRFAEVMGMLLLASIVQRFRVRPLSSQLPRLSALFTLRPASPILARVEAV
jgi:cytochrome P450